MISTLRRTSARASAGREARSRERGSAPVRVRDDVGLELGPCVVVGDDADAVQGSILGAIRPDALDRVSLELAHGVVAAVEPVAADVLNVVPDYVRHGHLVDRDRAHRRTRDPVVPDLAFRAVDEDPFAPTLDLAALHDAGPAPVREGDVDALCVRHSRADLAVADRDRRVAYANTVQPGPVDADALEHDVVGTADLDPRLAAHDREIADDDAVRRHDDPPTNNGPRGSDQTLRVVEDDRPLVHACGQPHGRRRGAEAHARGDQTDERYGQRDREPRRRSLGPDAAVEAEPEVADDDGDENDRV